MAFGDDAGFMLRAQRLLGANYPTPWNRSVVVAFHDPARPCLRSGRHWGDMTIGCLLAAAVECIERDHTFKFTIAINHQQLGHVTLAHDTDRFVDFFILETVD